MSFTECCLVRSMVDSCPTTRDTGERSCRPRRCLRRMNRSGASQRAPPASPNLVDDTKRRVCCRWMPPGSRIVLCWTGRCRRRRSLTGGTRHAIVTAKTEDLFDEQMLGTSEWPDFEGDAGFTVPPKAMQELYASRKEVNPAAAVSCVAGCESGEATCVRCSGQNLSRIARVPSCLPLEACSPGLARIPRPKSSGLPWIAACLCPVWSDARRYRARTPGGVQVEGAQAGAAGATLDDARVGGSREVQRVGPHRIARQHRSAQQGEAAALWTLPRSNLTVSSAPGVRRLRDRHEPQPAL